MRKLACRLVLLISLFFVACSPAEFGNSVLRTLGVSPPKSKQDPKENLASAVLAPSEEEEYFIGRAVAAKILSLYPIYKDEKLTSYLNRVGGAVAFFSNKPETFGGYHFMIIDTPQVNAMAAPGGFIFVSRGMMELLLDEEQLAAVLAHEVAHVALSHGIKAISQENADNAINVASQLAGALSCNQVVQQATAVFGKVVDDIAGTLLERGYSREQEFEADRMALQIMIRAGFNTQASPAVLTELERREQGGSGGWFDTHPAAKDRLTEVFKFLKEIGISIVPVGIDKRTKRFILAAKGS